MPKIFQYLQYIIRFYTNDHLPIHVHVQIQEREIKVEFHISGDSLTLIFKKVKGKKPLTEDEAKEVSIFLKSYYKKIIDKWQTVFIYSKKGKLRNHQQKAKQESLIVESAKYINDFIIAITFSNKKTKMIDFLPLFHKYVKGENLNYFAPESFKKFIIRNGNIYWGEDEDVIFPVNLLLKKISKDESEEVLYII